jgi:hypothetical protein
MIEQMSGTLGVHMHAAREERSRFSRAISSIVNAVVDDAALVALRETPHRPPALGRFYLRVHTVAVGEYVFRRMTVARSGTCFPRVRAHDSRVRANTCTGFRVGI